MARFNLKTYKEAININKINDFVNQQKMEQDVGEVGKRYNPDDPENLITDKDFMGEAQPITEEEYNFLKETYDWLQQQLV